MNQSLSRRNFLSAVTAVGVTAKANPSFVSDGKPAALGGEAVRKTPFPSWPVFDQREEQAVVATLRSGKWFRGNGQNVTRFETEYARLMGAQHCLATANGTSALLSALMALNIGPGDEVIVPPYTFIASINVILARHALPVFVDTDLETFQIDARKIEAAITERTRAIMPVHLGGAAADLDAILAVAQKHKLPVIEDACQSHLAEWRNRRVGTYGAAGCYSFQASKNLNSGEGGALLTNDAELHERCFTAHNNGRGQKSAPSGFQYQSSGLNLRLGEFQAALLLAQMTRLEDFARTREANAQYLTSMLREIPGLTPARMYEGCTRNAYHLYMFRYDARQFAGLTRDGFLNALKAEGIPAASGYGELNKEPFLQNALQSRAYQTAYGKAHLAHWVERNHTPANARLCSEAVWFTQNMLLASRTEMEQIAEAIRKIRKYSSDLVTK
ncbi:MAG: DegT/DnrJ/EryC1/StrS family aminotransferase [Acidobacteria bacterium]|nr:DegT/DnrJ/EryC1/StrS family aminotransferase [Acidobacteriota bacterium]